LRNVVGGATTLCQGVGGKASGEVPDVPSGESRLANVQSVRFLRRLAVYGRANRYRPEKRSKASGNNGE
jgi:hypothetical protein